jgi:uncharacterized protein YjbI with pentapeptide repeats
MNYIFDLLLLWLGAAFMRAIMCGIIKCDKHIYDPIEITIFDIDDRIKIKETIDKFKLTLFDSPPVQDENIILHRAFIETLQVTIRDTNDLSFCNLSNKRICYFPDDITISALGEKFINKADWVTLQLGKQCNLSMCNFYNAVLLVAGTNCNFNQITASYSDWSYSKLPKSSFVNADLRYSTFSDTNLMNADFTGADLSNADFTGAILANANFTGAILTNTKFDMADLTNANMLDTDISTASFVNSKLNRTKRIVTENSKPEQKPATNNRSTTSYTESFGNIMMHSYK